MPKLYKVFDSKGNLIHTVETQAEISKKLNVSLYYFCKSINDNEGFVHPNTKQRYYISMEQYEKPANSNKKKNEGCLRKGLIEDIVDLPGELWKEVPGYPNNFASNKGRVKFIDKNGNTCLNHISHSTNKTNIVYYVVTLLDKDTAKLSGRFRLSRVIAKTFIDETLTLCRDDVNKLEVHFKDKNSSNHNVENLSILPHKDIIRATMDSGIIVGHIKRPCYATKNNIRRVYNSVADLMEDIKGVRKATNNGEFHAAVRTRS